MKTYTTKLLNKECLLVESDRPTTFGFYSDEMTIFDPSKDFRDSEIKSEGNWQQVGKLSELTDEDVIPLLTVVKNYGTRNDKLVNLYEQGGGSFIPLKAFFSALEAEGLFLNGNPLGEKPYYSPVNYGTFPQGGNRFESDVKKWNEAEARTFDKTRTILLVKN